MENLSEIISYLKETALENKGKLTLDDLEIVHQAFGLEDAEMAELMDICEQMGIRVVVEPEITHTSTSLDQIMEENPDFVESIDYLSADPLEIIIERERKKSIANDDCWDYLD